jgi:hypothetical protein
MPALDLSRDGGFPGYDGVGSLFDHVLRDRDLNLEVGDTILLNSKRNGESFCATVTHVNEECEDDREYTVTAKNNDDADDEREYTCRFTHAIHFDKDLEVGDEVLAGTGGERYCATVTKVCKEAENGTVYTVQYDSMYRDAMHITHSSKPNRPYGLFDASTNAMTTAEKSSCFVVPLTIGVKLAHFNNLMRCTANTPLLKFAGVRAVILSFGLDPKEILHSELDEYMHLFPGGELSYEEQCRMARGRADGKFRYRPGNNRPVVAGQITAAVVKHLLNFCACSYYECAFECANTEPDELHAWRFDHTNPEGIRLLSIEGESEDESAYQARLCKQQKRTLQGGTLFRYDIGGSKREEIRSLRLLANECDRPGPCDHKHAKLRPVVEGRASPPRTSSNNAPIHKTAAALLLDSVRNTDCPNLGKLFELEIGNGAISVDDEVLAACGGSSNWYCAIVTAVNTTPDPNICTYTVKFSDMYQDTYTDMGDETLGSGFVRRLNIGTKLAHLQDLMYLCGSSPPITLTAVHSVIKSFGLDPAVILPSYLDEAFYNKGHTGHVSRASNVCSLITSAIVKHLLGKCACGKCDYKVASASGDQLHSWHFDHTNPNGVYHSGIRDTCSWMEARRQRKKTPRPFAVPFPSSTTDRHAEMCSLRLLKVNCHRPGRNCSNYVDALGERPKKLRKWTCL